VSTQSPDAHAIGLVDGQMTVTIWLGHWMEETAQKPLLHRYGSRDGQALAVDEPDVHSAKVSTQLPSAHRTLVPEHPLGPLQFVKLLAQDPSSHVVVRVAK
jgi:hypothetical protein